MSPTGVPRFGRDRAPMRRINAVLHSSLFPRICLGGRAICAHSISVMDSRPDHCHSSVAISTNFAKNLFWLTHLHPEHTSVTATGGLRELGNRSDPDNRPSRPLNSNFVTTSVPCITPCMKVRSSWVTSPAGGGGCACSVPDSNRDAPIQRE